MEWADLKSRISDRFGDVFRHRHLIFHTDHGVITAFAEKLYLHYEPGRTGKLAVNLP